METLVIDDAVARRLRTYLDVDHERMAFLLANPATGLVTEELYLTDDDDYASQGPYHMELADHVRPRILGWATPSALDLVELHAHHGLGAPTTFSPTDLDGLSTVVPQILWRLPGRSYVAVVLGDDDLDVLAWTTRHGPPGTLATVAMGPRTSSPTGVALNSLLKETGHGR